MFLKPVSQIQTPQQKRQRLLLLPAEVGPRRRAGRNLGSSATDDHNRRPGHELCRRVRNERERGSPCRVRRSRSRFFPR